GARASLEHQHRAGHGPALVDLADALGVGHDDVVEELLTEVGTAVDLADDAQRDARGVDRYPEPGEPTVLGHTPIGPREAQPVVGEVRPRAPHLRAVEDPRIA